MDDMNNSGCCEIRPLDAMNHSRFRILWKKSASWTQASKCYEKVRAMDDIKDFGLWTRGSRRNEQLRVMDDMNDSRSYQFKPLDVVNQLGLWMTLTTLGHELSALDTMNTLGLWLR